MEIVFIGTGYVGLVSGVMLASIGHKVTCIDKDKKKIDELKKGQIPIYEPGLADYLEKTINSKNIDFVSDIKDVKGQPEAVFICVGTPSRQDGSADLDNVYDSSLEVAKIFPDSVIVIKSTVPPGTCKNLEIILKSEKCYNQVASNPEFLSEGNAVSDFLYPDRIIIGVSGDKSERILRRIYEPFEEKGYTILSSSRESAEMIKYASNSFLASRIAFVNEIANLCEKTGADIQDVTQGVGMDPRIGPSFLKSGPGFGGSCFPKDILALQHLSEEVGERCDVLEGIIESNKKRPQKLVDKMAAELGGLSGKIIGVLGMTYKAGTDDVRSSPAIEIANLLLENGAYLCAYDPKGMKNAKREISIDFVDDAMSAARGAHAIVVLTEWDEFSNLNFKDLASEMHQKVIFDFRNIIDCQDARSNGFKIYQIGKE